MASRDLREPDKSSLEARVEKSGKPLEIMISSYLDAYGWKDVWNTETFFDCA